MNKERRKSISAIISELPDASTFEDLKWQIEEIRDEEQEYYDNMPESFQNGEKGEVAQAAISALETALDALDQIIASIEEANQALDEAVAA